MDSEPVQLNCLTTLAIGRVGRVGRTFALTVSIAHQPAAAIGAAPRTQNLTSIPTSPPYSSDARSLIAIFSARLTSAGQSAELCTICMLSGYYGSLSLYTYFPFS
jgi:hypothetical protein